MKKTDWIDFIKNCVIITLLGTLIVTVSLWRSSVNSLEPYLEQQRLVTSTSTTEQVERIFNDINHERELEGIPALKINSQLMISAQTKACDMAERNYFSHVSPDGATPWKFITEAGYYFTFAGENLSQGYIFTDAVQAWVHSPTHQRNIVEPLFEDTGIGICGGYIVQHFGAL